MMLCNQKAFDVYLECLRYNDEAILLELVGMTRNELVDTIVNLINDDDTDYPYYDIEAYEEGILECY